MPQFDYKGARQAGYTDEEIKPFLAEYKNSRYEKPEKSDSFFGAIAKNARNFARNFTNPIGEPEIPKEENQTKINEKLLKNVPNFNALAALQSGYSADEINEFLQERQPEKSALEKGGRLAGQLGLGLAENALLPYEISVSPLASKDAQNIAYRETLSSDLENLMNKKAVGQWTPQDQEQFNNISKQLQDAQESGKFAQSADLGIRNIAEKVTGADLHPEGALEKGINWIGFIKDPKKIGSILKTGITPKNLIKSVSPTGTEFLRGAGAGIALQMAEDGDYGPIGTMGAAIVGDLLVGGLAETVKGAKNLVTKPKETLAKVAAQFTPKDKLELQKNIIKDFREAGIQADIGTITDSNLLKMTQSRLSQSGLTGKAYEDLMKKTTNQIENDYKKIAQELGEMKYSTNFEAGLSAKEGMKTIREADLAASRRLYKESDAILKEGAKVGTERILSSISNLEKNLTPGMIKSVEQSKVLDIIKNMQQDLITPSGVLKGDVKALMNNKIALNDIINYEVQGGAKQLLKNIVAELDRAIISHGKENPIFAKSYVNANKRFSEHAKTFRNRDALNLLKDGDPTHLLNKMNSVHGIKNVEKILKKTPEGREIFNNLKRFKLDQAVGNNLIDSTTQQAKLGTFSKLLEKGKNREVIKEILGTEAFKRLERLQKNAGRLAESVQKYYNASKSGSHAVDAAIVVQGMNSFGHLLTGNPWPMAKVTGGLIAGKQLNNLLANPEFLKLVEEAMLSAEKSSKQNMIESFERLKPYFASVTQNNKEENQSSSIP